MWQCGDLQNTGSSAEDKIQAILAETAAPLNTALIYEPSFKMVFVCVPVPPVNTQLCDW